MGTLVSLLPHHLGRQSQNLKDRLHKPILYTGKSCLRSLKFLKFMVPLLGGLRNCLQRSSNLVNQRRHMTTRKQNSLSRYRLSEILLKELGLYYWQRGWAQRPCSVWQFQSQPTGRDRWNEGWVGTRDQKQFWFLQRCPQCAQAWVCAKEWLLLV